MAAAAAAATTPVSPRRRPLPSAHARSGACAERQTAQAAPPPGGAGGEGGARARRGEQRPLVERRPRGGAGAARWRVRASLGTPGTLGVCVGIPGCPPISLAKPSPPGYSGGPRVPPPPLPCPPASPGGPWVSPSVPPTAPHGTPTFTSVPSTGHRPPPGELTLGNAGLGRPPPTTGAAPHHRPQARSQTPLSGPWGAPGGFLGAPSTAGTLSPKTEGNQGLWDQGHRDPPDDPGARAAVGNAMLGACGSGHPLWARIAQRGQFVPAAKRAQAARGGYRAGAEPWHASPGTEWHCPCMAWHGMV